MRTCEARDGAFSERLPERRGIGWHHSLRDAWCRESAAPRPTTRPRAAASLQRATRPRAARRLPRATTSSRRLELRLDSRSVCKAARTLGRPARKLYGEASDGIVAASPEISGMILLVDLRRLPEHRAVLGRISSLGRRERRVCCSEEVSGSTGRPINEDAGSTGRPNIRWAAGCDIEPAAAPARDTTFTLDISWPG